MIDIRGIAVGQHGQLIGNPNDNLDVYPGIDRADSPFVTIGDLHGNALKLFYFLIQKGILNVNAEQYDAFKAIYNTPPHKLTPQQIEQFKTLVDSIDVQGGTLPHIRILGDELADRGMNDFYTLYLLNHLDKKKVKFDINQSNHTIELSLAHELKQAYTDTMGGDQCRSMANMGILLSRGLIEQQEIDKLADIHKDHQTIISYSLGSDNKISIYSHAPIGYDMIKNLANKFDVEFKDNNAKQLAYTIEKINQKYLDLLKSGKLHTVINQNVLNLISAYDSRNHEYLVNRDITPEKYPLEFITWGRDYSKLNRTLTPEGTNLEVSYVHGHDSYDPLDQDNLFCLDSLFGKSGFNCCGRFRDQDGVFAVENPILLQENRLLTLEELYQLAKENNEEAFIPDRLALEQKLKNKYFPNGALLLQANNFQSTELDNGPLTIGTINDLIMLKALDKLDETTIQATFLTTDAEGLNKAFLNNFIKKSAIGEELPIEIFNALKKVKADKFLDIKYWPISELKSKFLEADKLIVLDSSYFEENGDIRQDILDALKKIEAQYQVPFEKWSIAELKKEFLRDDDSLSIVPSDFEKDTRVLTQNIFNGLKKAGLLNKVHYLNWPTNELQKVFLDGDSLNLKAIDKFKQDGGESSAIELIAQRLGKFENLPLRYWSETTVRDKYSLNGSPNIEQIAEAIKQNNNVSHFIKAFSENNPNLAQQLSSHLSEIEFNKYLKQDLENPHSVIAIEIAFTSMESESINCFNQFSQENKQKIPLTSWPEQALRDKFIEGQKLKLDDSSYENSKLKLEVFKALEGIIDITSSLSIDKWPESELIKRLKNTDGTANTSQIDKVLRQQVNKGTNEPATREILFDLFKGENTTSSLPLKYWPEKKLVEHQLLIDNLKHLNIAGIKAYIKDEQDKTSAKKQVYDMAVQFNLKEDLPINFYPQSTILPNGYETKENKIKSIVQLLTQQYQRQDDFNLTKDDLNDFFNEIKNPTIDNSHFTLIGRQGFSYQVFNALSAEIKQQVDIEHWSANYAVQKFRGDPKTFEQDGQLNTVLVDKLIDYLTYSFPLPSSLQKPNPTAEDRKQLSKAILTYLTDNERTSLDKISPSQKQKLYSALRKIQTLDNPLINNIDQRENDLRAYMLKHDTPEHSKTGSTKNMLQDFKSALYNEKSSTIAFESLKKRYAFIDKHHSKVIKAIKEALPLLPSYYFDKDGNKVHNPEPYTALKIIERLDKNKDSLKPLQQQKTKVLEHAWQILQLPNGSNFTDTITQLSTCLENNPDFNKLQNPLAIQRATSQSSTMECLLEAIKNSQFDDNQKEKLTTTVKLHAHINHLNPEHKKISELKPKHQAKIEALQTAIKALANEEVTNIEDIMKQKDHKFDYVFSRGTSRTETLLAQAHHHCTPQQAPLKSETEIIQTFKSQKEQLRARLMEAAKSSKELEPKADENPPAIPRATQG